MAETKYGCPMCHGEGKITWETYKDESAPQRIIAYGVVTIGILLGASILYHTTTPRDPTPMEQCATSCGPGRFRQYTEFAHEWTEITKGDAPNIPHQPTPAKCECLTPGFPMTPPEFSK